MMQATCGPIGLRTVAVMPGVLPLAKPDACVLYLDMRGGEPQVTDHSGMAGHATNTGSVRAGGPRQVVRTFDGSGDFMTLTGPGSLGDTLTVMTWIKPTSVSAARQTVVGRNNGAGLWHLELGYNNFDRVAIVVPTLGSPESARVAQAGVWQMIAYVRTGAGASTHTFYFNGAAVALSVNPADSFTDSTVHEIGRRSAGSQEYAGDIGIVQIYNRALTAADMKRLFAETAPRFKVAM